MSEPRPDDPRDLADLTDLTGPLAQAIRRAATEHPESDPLRLSTSLRTSFPEAPADLVSAMATQATLARRAAPRLGEWAEEMILDRIALEQATRRDVARYRAARLLERLGDTKPHPSLVDLGCGIGVDARAFAEAGAHVTVVDIDPWRCAAALANVQLAVGAVDAVCGDVTAIELDGFGAAFVDPARRDSSGPLSTDGRRSRPQSNPQTWSPPWSWVRETAARIPLVAKASAGLNVTLVPDDAEIEWIDHDGDTVEACVWFAPLATASRRATVVRPAVSSSDPPVAESVSSLSRHSIATEVAEVNILLLEPAPAVRRARLVDELAQRLGAARIADNSDWLTAAAIESTSLAHAWRVVRELPAAPKALRTALADNGSITWKTADTRVSAADQERRVGHRPARSGAATTVVLTADGRAFEVAAVRPG